MKMTDREYEILKHGFLAGFQGAAGYVYGICLQKNLEITELITMVDMTEDQMLDKRTKKILKTYEPENMHNPPSVEKNDDS